VGAAAPTIIHVAPPMDASNLLVHHYTIEPYYLSTANDGPQYMEYNTPIIPLTEHNFKGNVMTQRPTSIQLFILSFFLQQTPLLLAAASYKYGCIKQVYIV